MFKLKYEKFNEKILYLCAFLTVHLNANDYKEAGQQARTFIKDGIGEYKWIIAFVILALALWLPRKALDYLDRRYETSGGQEPPKVAKWGTSLGTFIATIAGCYLLLGILFFVFGKSSFENTWEKLVQDVIKEFFAL